MNAAAISAAVLSMLTAFQGILPLLGNIGTAGTIVTNIIAALTKIIPVVEQLAPLIGNEVQLLYTGIKNIIANIRGDVETDAQQDADLDALDAQVDASWDSISAQFDPDAPTQSAPASGTSTTS